MNGQEDKNTLRQRNQAWAQSSRRGLASRGGKLVQVRMEAADVMLLDQIKAASGATTDKDAVLWALRRATLST